MYKLFKKYLSLTLILSVSSFTSHANFYPGVPSFPSPEFDPRCSSENGFEGKCTIEGQFGFHDRKAGTTNEGKDLARKIKTKSTRGQCKLHAAERASSKEHFIYNGEDIYLSSVKMHFKLCFPFAETETFHRR
jgi:hypothetical protein